MGEELEQLNLLYGHDGWGVSCSGTILDDLDWMLDRCFPNPDDSDEMEGVPPLDEIDLNNPEHLELLQERLERALNF